MKRVTRGHAWTAGAVLSLAAIVAGSWDRTMAWLTARENHARFEEAVQKCELAGRRWFKGDCVPTRMEEP